MPVSSSLITIQSVLFKKVYTANDGVEALKVFKEEDINILLLDYVMPNFSGIEVVKEIKNIDKKVPIIITSGYNDKEKLINCIRLGIIDYIEKPLRYEHLMEAFIKAHVWLEENNMLTINLSKDISYDYTIKSIIKNGESIKLTKQEVEFLEILLKNRSKLIFKEDMMNRVFGRVDAELNALRNILYRLRKKVGNDLIVTVKDLGYMIPL